MILFWQFVQSAAAAATMPLIWSMYADAADFSEWRNTRRATGLLFSSVVLGQKAGIALGSALPLWIMGSAGYTPLGAKTPAVIHAIKLSMGLIPGSIAFAAALVCWFYNLSEKQMETVQRDLHNRRNSPTPI